jgi:uncharacterized small protein (DUF1192 family)
LIERIENIESSYRFEKDEGMRQTAIKHGGLRQRVMTEAQAMKLKRLSEEAHQALQFEPDLSQAEADRRIAALKAEIELANSF